jgi:VanZ family protein
MASRIIGAVALAWLACFAYLTLLPDIPDLPGLASRDRVLGTGHLVASLILAALVYLWLVTARPRLSTARAAAIAFGASTGFGLLVELIQFPVPEREPQVSDAVLDAVGSALAVAALAAVSRPTLRRPQVPVITGALGAVLVASTAAAAIWGTTETAAEVRCPGDIPSERLPPAGAVDPAEGDGVPRDAGRVTRGLVALFDFEDLPARDSANGGESGLELAARGDVSPIEPHGVRLAGDDAVLTTDGRAANVTDRIDDAFTLEAWVRPDSLAQSGPARIVSSSDGVALTDVNFHLGQERHCLSVRVDAGGTAADWLLVDDVFARARPAWHVVATYDRGRVRVYVDGERRNDGDLADADLSGWSRDRPLLVGNEATRDRPFHGVIYLVAVYDRALRAGEVARNYAAGI